MQCFWKYQDSTIASKHLLSVMRALAKPGQHLMPALIDRYHQVSDQPRELFPLLEYHLWEPAGVSGCREQRGPEVVRPLII
jgi:hypothetical protein